MADIVKPKSDEDAVRSARRSMLAMTILGLLVALAVLYIPGFGLQQLWWIFNTISACVLMPTVLSLYRENLSERGVFWGILIAFVVGIPVFIYGNVVNRPGWIVGASVFIVAVSTICCLAIHPKGGAVAERVSGTE